MPLCRYNGHQVHLSIHKIYWPHNWRPVWPPSTTGNGNQSLTWWHICWRATSRRPMKHPIAIPYCSYHIPSQTLSLTGHSTFLPPAVFLFSLSLSLTPVSSSLLVSQAFQLNCTAFTHLDDWSENKPAS